jgi:Protein kinase domain
LLLYVVLCEHGVLDVRETMMAEGWQIPGYTHLAMLGAGAFGRTYLAEWRATGQVGVLKYVPVSDETVRDAFRRESVLLKGVNSPYVAQWYGHLEGPGLAAIFMEAVPGVPLRTLLTERGAQPPEAALAVLKGSLLGLAAAHARGVVHRDYKPPNVMVRPDDVSKLIDFGVAGLVGEVSGAGTPRYMAPEQWNREPSTPATDVYSATCVFVECLTGSSPFDADTVVALRHQHLTAAPPVQQVPAALHPLVLAGMAKDPADRPADAAGFVAELESVAEAAYGADWESRGWAVLRAGAVALAGMAPLAVAGAVVAAQSPGAAAGAAAGSTAGGSTAGVASAGLGAKVALAVAGVLTIGVVGTAAVVVAQGTGHAHRTAAAPVLTAGTTAFQTPAGGWLTGSYVQLSGGDPVVRAKLNAALRQPLDSEIAQERNDVTRFHQSCTPGTTQVSSQITLRRPGLLAVSYAFRLGSCIHDGANGTDNVILDLRTGAALLPKDIFRPEVLTAQGINALHAKLIGHMPSFMAGECGGMLNFQSQVAQLLPALTRPSIDLTRPSIYVLMDNTQPLSLTDSGLVIWAPIDHVCGDIHWDVTYPAVRSLLRPEIAAQL